MEKTFSGNYIRLDDLKYPCSQQDIRKEFPNVSFPREMTEDIALEFGYAVVYDSEQPSVVAGRIEEADPIEIDGEFHRVWSVVDFTEQEYAEYLQAQKTMLRDEVNRLHERAMEIGKPYTFPNGAVEHIQLRPKDLPVLQFLLNDADRQTDPEAAVQNFRTSENNVHVLNALEMADLVNKAFDYVREMSSKSWMLKDAITAAVSIEDLPELPVSLTLI